MDFTIETDRLTLRVLQANEADKVLTFLEENVSTFEAFEPIVGENFYTIEHQKSILDYEYAHFLRLEMMRYYIFEKNNPEKIIGTVSFRNIVRPVYSCCTLGYKMHKDYTQKGYCYEAIAELTDLLAYELGIHRVEAYVMPENIPSICLLEKLGFVREGLLRDKIFIGQRFEDHYLYSLITNS